MLRMTGIAFALCSGRLPSEPNEPSSFRSAMNSPADSLPPAAQPLSPSSRTSRLAVASLVLGILGVLILPAVAGLVCGIVAIIQINRSAGALRGKGIAIAGTVVSGVMLAMIPIFAILLAIMLPALAQAKGKAQTIMGLNNVKQIALAVHLYADDSKGVLPGATNWCDALKPYVGSDGVFRRPAEPTAAGRAFSSYGLNARLAGAKMADVNPSTVLIFELESPRWNATGGAGEMRRPGRGADTVSIGFADGHAESIGSGPRLDSLRWEP